MTVDMVVNIGLLLLLGRNNFVILYISNIGYVFCHVLALSGFLLLRRDRPQWPRPIKMGNVWLPIAGVLALFNLVLVVYGVYDQALASYLGFYEFTGLPLYLGIGVLSCRCSCSSTGAAVQDKAKITFRDRDVPTMPNEAADGAAPRGVAGLGSDRPGSRRGRRSCRPRRMSGHHGALPGPSLRN
jgi:amino acid transporter